MLFKNDVLRKIAAGDVTLAFRRWRRPTVRAGGRLRTVVGELDIREVAPVAVDGISADDARRAGFDTREQLVAALAGPEDRTVYRIAFAYHGADPRIALRDEAHLEKAQLSDLVARLDRLDRGGGGPAWTGPVLALIGRFPGRRAADLAAEVGMETPTFKRRVRRLKELGLTESLDIGYRLSPRGDRVLAHLSGR